MKKERFFILVTQEKHCDSRSLSQMTGERAPRSTHRTPSRNSSRQSEQRKRIHNVSYFFGYTLQNSARNSSNFPSSIACRDFLAISNRYSRLCRESSTPPVASPTLIRCRRYPSEYLRDTAVSYPGSIGIFSDENLYFSPQIFRLP